MTKQDIKHALISLLIGAILTFLTTVFQGLVDFLKAHGSEIVGGAGATITYLVKTHKS